MKFMIHRESQPALKDFPPCDNAIWCNGQWMIKLYTAEDFKELADEVDEPIMLWPKKDAHVLPLITIHDDFTE